MHDTAGRAPALDLEIADPPNAVWIRGGLRVDLPTTSQSGPARILTLSPNPGARNFTLGQSGTRYIQRLRVDPPPNTSDNVEIATPDSLTPVLTHVVYTRDAAGTAVFYLNGQEVSRASVPSTFDNWDESWRVGVANELDWPTSDRTWLGALPLLAVYCRALSADDVRNNFRAGPDP